MQPSTKQIFFAMAVIAVFMASVVISQYFNLQRKAKEHKIRLETIGKLQFRGKVINSKVYKYGTKNCYIICVKIDSANVKDFYIYNGLDCLKIKNGIATLPAGYLNHTLGVVDSVAVNINNNGGIMFHYKGNVRDERPLAFDPTGVSESDMNACN
jgi:hypothetical protein